MKNLFKKLKNLTTLVFKKFIQTLKEMRTTKGIVVLLIAYMIFHGWAVIILLIGLLTQTHGLTATGTLVLAFWFGPFTPLIPLVIATAFFIRKYILFDHNKIKVKNEKECLPMEICRFDGYCISIEFLHSDSLEFSYYNLNSNNKMDTYYVSSASKYEQTINLDKENSIKFLEKLIPNFKKLKFETKDGILLEIVKSFKHVKSIDEITKYFEQHQIEFKLQKWVEFYD